MTNNHGVVNFPTVSEGVEIIADELDPRSDPRLVTLLPREKSPYMDARKIIPTRLIPTTLSSFLPLSYGAYRAGKAETLARSVGENPGILIKYPQATSWGGGIAGALLTGTFLGDRITRSGENFINSHGWGNYNIKLKTPPALKSILKKDYLLDTTSGKISGGVLGKLIGGSLGAIIGSGLVGLSRTMAINRIQKKFDSSYYVEPTYRRGRMISFGSGAHDLGRIDAFEALTKKTDMSRTPAPVILGSFGEMAARIGGSPLSLWGVLHPFGSVPTMIASGAVTLGSSVEGKFLANRKLHDILGNQTHRF